MIPYGRQDVTAADIAAVSRVLRSDYLTQGSVVPRFERALADYCGAAHAVATNSATSALHIACLALGLGPGDRLWTSPNTFVASANCALYCGAEVDFVDIDPTTYNLSVKILATKLHQAEQTGTLPKILIPVHFSGQSCDMMEIAALAQRYGFRIIEDASHAIGARYQNEPIGSCRFSDITVFSFHPVKIITTGEGGMATTQSSALAERLARLRSHGVTRDPMQMPDTPDGSWCYQQIELGFNYRMTDIQAALGVSQLERIDQYIDHRAALAKRYDECLADLPVIRPVRSSQHRSALHLYPIQVPSDRDGIFSDLRQAGIGINVHYIPVHTQPYYRQFGFRSGDFPQAEAYYSRALSLPLYPTMTHAQQDRVIAALRTAVLHRQRLPACEQPSQTDDRL